MSERPFLIVIAGPNGSGKSTLTSFLLQSGIDFGFYINPDEIALTINLPEPQRSVQAQNIADFRRDACLSRTESFSFETVMSHPSKVDFMLRAHDAGYDIALFFVATSDPEINVTRVENRVSHGGHDVPHDRIRSRYYRSLSLLCHAVLVARRTVIFDNSALIGYLVHRSLPTAKSGLRPVAAVVREGDHYEITLEAEVPSWVFEHLVQPLSDLAEAGTSGVTISLRQKEGLL